MQTEVEFGNGVIVVPEKVISKMNRATEKQLKFLLALLSDRDFTQNTEENFEKICEIASLSNEDGKDALDFWTVEGIISRRAESSSVSVKQRKTQNGDSVTVVQSVQTPKYSGKEIEKIMSENKYAAKLADECQRLFGKMFSSHEINKFLSFIEYLKLDHDYILLLFSYCKSIGKTSVHYAEKVAYSLYNEGITDVSDLEEYIVRKEQKNSMDSIVRRVFGIPKRSFSTKENKFIELWAESGVREEILKEAYDIAIDNTNGPSMPYVNKIISNWNEAGYTNLEQIREASKNFKETKGVKSNQSHDTDEFFEAALRRTLENADTAVK